MSIPPIVAEVYRGNAVESCHRGSAVVIDQRGRQLFACGDLQRAIFPRSALKPLQVLPLLEANTGNIPLDSQQIALACASHNGESIHVESVNRWLQSLSLNAEHLACGASLPMHQDSAHQLLREQTSPTRAHHNCSGKHSGMLALCRALNLSIEDYQRYEHPVQQRWLQVLSELTGLDASAFPWDYDGCGIPAVAFPLPSLAFAFAQLADPKQQSEPRQTAMRRVTQAFQEQPYMVAGIDRCCTRVMQVTGGEVLVKTGAEGVFAGWVPNRGIGFALKAEDGNTRASETLLGAVLCHLNLIDESQFEVLKPFFARPILNSRQQVVGHIKACPLNG